MMLLLPSFFACAALRLDLPNETPIGPVVPGGWNRKNMQSDAKHPWPYDEKRGRTTFNFVLTKESLRQQIRSLQKLDVIEIRLAGENFTGEEQLGEKGYKILSRKQEIVDLKQAFIDSKEFKVTGSTRWALRCTIDWVLKSKKEIRWIFYSFEFDNPGWSDSMRDVMRKLQIKSDSEGTRG